MPLDIGGRKYEHLRNYIARVKRVRPDIKDPGAYAATVARAAEPNFDEEAAAEKRRKAKGRG